MRTTDAAIARRGRGGRPASRPGTYDGQRQRARSVGQAGGRRRVELIGRPRGPAVARNERRAPHVVLGRGATGVDGRFQFDAARTSRIGFLQVQALAAAPGFGLNWAAPNPDAEQPSGEIRLRSEHVIRGN